jgi:hypothetical protein
MIGECRGEMVVELETDHTPHLSRTKELAEAMQQFDNAWPPPDARAPRPLDHAAREAVRREI